MKAALLEAPGQPLVIADDIAIQEPGNGQVRVRIQHCGICHSDLSVIDGAFPVHSRSFLGMKLPASSMLSEKTSPC